MNVNENMPMIITLVVVFVIILLTVNGNTTHRHLLAVIKAVIRHVILTNMPYGIEVV
jgi:hypothetical protein